MILRKGVFMITRQKVLLVTKAPSVAKFVARFEAVKAISDVSQIFEVWENNKTPLILGTAVADCPIIYLPENGFADDKAFIEFCHERGFECGEYQTGIKYDANQERCILCELASLKGMPTSLETYNKTVDREVDCIIYSSPRFYVTSELGALKQGYLMIVPKQHVLSVAQFNAVLMNEYEQVCQDLEYILQGAYPEASGVTFMEHGSGPSGITSHKKSIVHAHTHVVTDFQLSDHHKRMVKLEPIDDITLADNTHYFSYQEGSDGQLMICMDDNVYVQRQFPRQVMAEELKLAPGQYNWRKVSFEENVHATLFHVFNYLKNAELPKRIADRTRGFVLGYAKREEHEE